MSGVILWLPGRDSLPIADQSTRKKRSSSQAQLQEVLPQDPRPKEPEIKANCIVASGSGSLPNLDMEVIEISSPQAWEEALQEIAQAGICGLDLETTGLDPLSARARLAQLSLPSGRVYVADLWDLAREGGSPLQDLGRLSVRTDIKKVGHNLKFDLGFIQASCSQRLHMSNLFDTMLASQVIWAGYNSLERAKKATKKQWKNKFPEQSLKALAERHLGIDLPKDLQASNWGAETLSPEQKAYAAKDAGVLLPLQSILQELLQKNRLEDIASLEFRALPSVIEMELTGLPLDTQACRALMDQNKAQAQEMLQNLQAEAQKVGFEPRRKKGKKYSPLLNPASSQDVLAFLQSQGYNISSTREESLKELAQAGCSWAGDLLQYRKISKQANDFMEKWLLKLSPIDNRLHGQYFQLSTRAGRFSSRDPNIQQIPKRGEEGLAIRRLFKAPPGRKLIKGDLSGIELRIMARLSGDKTMIEAFQAGQDLHKLTASKTSGLPIDQITKAQRQGAKAVNFLLIYGGQPELLQRRAKETYGVDMSLEEAKEAHRTFFQTYPGIAAFHEKQRILKNLPNTHFLHTYEKGVYSRQAITTQTLPGRKRIWGQKESGETLASINQLYNSPSQGTGADLIKAIMGEVYSSIPEEVKMIASVHDELVLEAPEALAQDMASLLLAIMRRVGSELLAPVPVDAEVEVLDSWGG